jgi:hypothetical protein
VANFTTLYYKPKLPSNHNPLPRYNVGENEWTLSLFQGQLGSASGSTNKILGNEEWRSVMLYVLTNLPEVQPFVEYVLNELVSIRPEYSSCNPTNSHSDREFVRESWHQSRDPTSQEHDTLLSRGAGVGRPDFISWFKQKVMSNLAPTFLIPSFSFVRLI